MVDLFMDKQNSLKTTLIKVFNISLGSELPYCLSIQAASSIIIYQVCRDDKWLCLLLDFTSLATQSVNYYY